MTTLSKNLLPIYEYELARGNQVAQVDDKKWSESDLVVWFSYPLHLEGLEHEIALDPNVGRFENHDPHYPEEIGFVDRKTGHTISGPITGEHRPDPEPLMR